MRSSKSYINKLLAAFYIPGIFFLVLVSCKKYITVDTPDTNVGIEAAFKSNTSAAQVLTGIYGEMSDFMPNGSLVSTCVLPDLSADNLTMFNPTTPARFIDYYKNSLEPKYLTSGSPDTYWDRCYATIMRTNIAIEQLVGNKFLSAKTQQRLLGEAYFMRAFSYFYLTNFYGNVPLVLTSTYQQSRSLKNDSSSHVYEQIRVDLQEAGVLLDYTYTSPDGLATTTDRVRPNLAAVNALRARVELYTKNYAAAEAAATEVLNQPLYQLSDVNAVFLANSPETIWGLQPVQIGKNTELGNFFLLPPTGPNTYSNPVYASPSLVNSFIAGDARKTAWLGSVSVAGTTYDYPAKYKRGFIANSMDITEYTIVFRIAEMYLIRAEARNELGNTEGAIEDLNELRASRRMSPSVDVTDPLPVLTLTHSSSDLRPVILQERRSELFAEWGHRWFDLRRSGTLNAVMTEEVKIKGGSWADYKSLYPIPQYELNTNPNLTQTPGYSD